MAGGGKIEIEKMASRFLARIEERVRDVALETHANLTEDTPRDTGWAANNWLAKINRPEESAKGSPTSIPLDSSTEALQEISKWRSGKGPINITNNVPYIRRLNAGSSSQAPAGFVEKAIQRAVRKFRSKI